MKTLLIVSSSVKFFGQFKTASEISDCEILTATSMSEAKKYLSLFCDKSNTAMQYVQKWMPIVAASQSVKGNETEREFLRSWIDVVDYE